jgi:GDP-mannose 6-dehydrogenase
MQLSIFGQEHPGILMAEALASQGHGVTSVDPSQDPSEAIANSALSVICLKDSETREGLSALCERIGAALRGKSRFHGLAVRGVLPAGAVHAIMIPVLERVSGKRAGVDFGIAVYPHFLGRDSVPEDYFAPPAIILGVTDDETLARMREMDIAVEAPEIVVDLAEAEALSRVDARALAEHLAIADEPVTLSRFVLSAESACAS